MDHQLERDQEGTDLRARGFCLGHVEFKVPRGYLDENATHTPYPKGSELESDLKAAVLKFRN